MKRHYLRDTAGFAALSGASRLIPLLPRSAVQRLSRWLAALIYKRRHKLRRRALANIDVAFGQTISSARKAAIARESFETMVSTGLDFLWFAAGPPGRIRRYVKFHPSFAQVIVSSGPLIAVTGHIGNWELLGLAATAYGRSLWSIAAPLSAPAIDSFLNRLRARNGMNIVPAKGAARVVEAALRRGETVAVLADQNTMPRQGGVFVDFFGLPAPMSRLPAVLAARTGARIVPVWCASGGEFYTAHALPDLDLPATGLDTAAITQRVAGALQQIIMQMPGQWLWAYSRWRYIPKGAAAARYPFYAQPCK